ncbi:MAG: cytochrome c-type biogenesis protein CcmH [Acidimicrobiia bacterium]|nr:cytochrome c-type biogenesis protein CcmH [Acidimicrobiia bacterium]
MNRRTLGWLAALVVGLGAFVYGATTDGPPSTNADRAYALANRYACPVCQGQSVAESDVPIARSIRAEIRKRVDQGQTDDEITAYLVGKFPGIDLNPSSTGFTGLVWILPVVVGAAALAGLVVVFRRWQQTPTQSATDDEVELVEKARRR